MDTIKLTNKQKTLIIAHRGASGIERENTIPAFVAAGNRSYYGVECDIHVTSDNKYIVYHDEETKRICDRNVVVDETDFATLRAIKIKATGTDEFSDAYKMPTPEEYADVMKRYDKIAVVELKGQMAEQNIREIIDIFKSRYDLGKVIFISFCFENLVCIRKILPAQNVQFLTSKLDDSIIERLAEHKFDLDVHYAQLSEKDVQKLHDKGIKINCWTCDDPQKAQKLIDWGVEYITTNILE